MKCLLISENCSVPMSIGTRVRVFVSCASLVIVTQAVEIRTVHALENGFSLELEAGAVWQGRNNAQTPAAATSTMPQGSRFSFKQLMGSDPNLFTRLSAAYGWGDRHQVHVLYAPLTITGTGTFAAPVLFQGSAFAPNTPTAGLYRFDSYRIGYRYKVLDAAQWQVWGGVTAKLRDANIALNQGALKASRANTGPVPLLSFYARRTLGTRWSAIVDVEGLAAPQGRAIDAAFKVRHQFSDGIGFSAGYRMLEGGAGNGKVYTFAWMHYGVLSLDYQF